jgi:hypothetical protein
MKRLILAMMLTSVAFLTQAPQRALAQVCNGGTITGATGYQVCSPTDCDPDQVGCSCSLSCAGVTYAVEYCSDYTTTNSCNSAGIGWDCGGGECSWNGPVVGGGGGGGGSSCPAECRQGSSCGAGYSSASGCKSNQVCFEAMIKSSHWSHHGRQN